MFGIGQAIKEMRDGMRVCRVGWNGRGMWLSFTPGRVVPAANFWSDQNRLFAHQIGGEAEVLPYITMKTADGKIVPWLASQTDILADDWQIAE